MILEVHFLLVTLILLSTTQHSRKTRSGDTHMRFCSLLGGFGKEAGCGLQKVLSNITLCYDS